MTENSETNLHHPTDVSPESMADEAVGYRPFPSVSQWAELSVSLRDVDNAHARMQEAKETVSTEALGSALEAARRAAAVDTNAIEGIFPTDRGFTRTVAEQTGAWQQLMDQRGAHVRPAFEDTLAGFDFILDHTTGTYPLTETAIKELHAVMLNSQDEITVYVSVNDNLQAQRQKLPKGEYKKQPNSPTRHDGSTFHYAPVADTAPEMARFIAELNSETFAALHPVVQAAYAHYAFVRIHPFADGNGRIARALASIFLYRSPGVPLVIYHDQQADYLDALEAADDGHFTQLVRFLAEKSVDTAWSIARSVRRHSTGGRRQAGAAGVRGQESGAISADLELSALLDAGAEKNSGSGAKAIGNDDVGKQQLAEGAVRLHELLVSALEREVAERRVGEQLNLRVRTGEDAAQPWASSDGIRDFHELGIDMRISVFADCPRLQPHPISWEVEIFAANHGGNPAENDPIYDYWVSTPESLQLQVFRRELDPVITQHLRVAAEITARDIVEEFLQFLINELKGV
ncbi:Fic family protein [Corynebacterium pseudodiphtheriticum]|uniref:Fic family protein n=1 Tax=Corynebacterium pseudodiphtheriticum TaxID=37637 RepID=UPI002549EF9B|nr:Fic family protein [Corynebacterium pseudodiphtheriticum]MDK8545195.1 Fic family protein [Corynebacterium pseudodiphtheriticum]